MSPAFANRSSDGAWPRSSSSARVTSTVTGPTAASARPASAIVSPSSHSTADAAAIAQSPARRSTFSCALPPPGRKGSRTSVSSSPSPTAVVNGPTWKSLIGTTRSPSGPRITTFAFAAEHTALRSSAASAWQSEPPIVPRLRTTGSAMTSSASANSGKWRLRSSDSCSSTWGVSAPMSSSPASSRMYERSVRSLMSIRTSGLARRSFIIGSRLWPPAMTRASGPWRSSAAIAPSTLVARSYSNGPGVCTSGPLLGRAGGPGLGAAITVSVRRGRRAGRAGRSGRLLGHHAAAEETTAHAGLLARLVALRRVGPDDRRALEALRTRLPRLGIQQPRRQAAALDVAQHPAARAGGGDRRLAAEAGERQRALRVDLADPRRADLPALREVAQALGGGAGVQAIDEPDGVLHARLPDEQALEQVDARVEVAVDVADDLGDRGALLDDLPDGGDRRIQAGRGLAQGGDDQQEVHDEDGDDRDDREQQDDSGGRHQSSFASSRITSSEPP